MRTMYASMSKNTTISGTLKTGNMILGARAGTWNLEPGITKAHKSAVIPVRNYLSSLPLLQVANTTLW